MLPDVFAHSGYCDSLHLHGQRCSIRLRVEDFGWPSVRVCLSALHHRWAQAEVVKPTCPFLLSKGVGEGREIGVRIYPALALEDFAGWRVVVARLGAMPNCRNTDRGIVDALVVLAKVVVPEIGQLRIAVSWLAVKVPTRDSSFGNATS
jgi:hypothetical protein